MKGTLFSAENKLVHNFKISGPDCFPAGTKVTMEDGSEKNIEDVELGDVVLSFNEETQTIEPKKVINLNSPIHNDLIQYTLSSGTTITSTFDHPYYVNGLELASYKPELTNSRYDIARNVNQIKVGDVVRFKDGGFHSIDNIEELPLVDTQTYIVTVEDTHNFYANGILVHD
jgi:intein/homing endonuclease